MICPLSPAAIFGFGAFHAFAVLLLFDSRLAPLPLFAFLLACAIAPFFPSRGFYLPIVSRGKRGEQGVALTFDDGPDPVITPRVLDLLDRHGACATFFVTGEKAARHPGVIREILSRGHTIGNHTYSHLPFVMLKGMRTLRREVQAAQTVLGRFGVVPLAFRPPVGVTNPHLWRVLLEQGMYCVNFRRRAVDMGNFRLARLSSKVLNKIAPGDILVLHDVAPPRASAELLLGEFDALIRGLKEQGRDIVPLARLIGREVMLREETPFARQPAAQFYDSLAADYDREQFDSAVSISRRAEYALFEAHLPRLFAAADRVLEIGAGTGIFTLAIARRCREVVAVDISGGMLEILRQKAAGERLVNIRTLAGNAETVDLGGTYSLACAFSSLEYLDDLPAFFNRLARHLEPGGTLYVITARRCLLRLFTQLGNAARQGLWLKAHNRREVEAMLSAAGFEGIQVSSHLLKSPVSGGMLLQVVARRGRGPLPHVDRVEETSPGRV
jgi:peptidoglycan/xylan/chitin deacetylase (PgdA/CDA1 family)/ubiquinone/menaquinone biosynthesis C-methylase UbiE